LDSILLNKIIGRKQCFVLRQEADLNIVAKIASSELVPLGA
jgi:hypothetical protein